VSEIYVEQASGELVAVQPQAYDSEDLLQKLIADHPELLAGRQMGGAEPRRWLLIGREMDVPISPDRGGWFSLDHLFIDQDAIPTLVEVKRASDTRIRREVVSQMLDYAANATAYWQIDRLRTMAGPLKDHLGVDDHVAFWQMAEDNLSSGRLRLVFLADEIPTELQRIIEFLNENLANAEVFGVTVAMYVGEGIKAYVPRVVGQTARALDKPSTAERRTIDELLAEASTEFHTCLGLIEDWAREHGLQVGTAAKSRKVVLNRTSILWAYPRDNGIQLALRVLSTQPDGEAARARVGEFLATTFGARATVDYPMLSSVAINANWADFRSQVLDSFIDKGV
jgi:hypothetical protein